MVTATENARAGARERRTGSRGWRLAAEVGAVALIVCLAAFLRWDRLELIEFANDQAWALDRARAWLAGGDFPLAGARSSLDTPMGPGEVYLYALPALLGPDPRLTAAFIGLLQVGAIGLTYLFGRRYFDWRVGFVASLFYAASPWAVHFGRKIWTPDPAPLFALLFVLALFAAVVDRRRWAMAVAWPLLAWALLIHPSTAVYAPVLLLGVALSWRWCGWRANALGLAAALLLAASYLSYQLTHGLEGLRVFGAVPDLTATTGAAALNLVLALASSAGFPDLLGYSFRGEARLPDLAPVNVAATALLVAGLGICLWQTVRAWRTQPNPAPGWERYALLLACLVLPVLVASRNALTLQPHYFIALLPLPFVVSGLALARLADLLATRLPLGRGPALALVPALALLLGLPQAALSHQYVNLIESNGPRGPYGTPLVYSERAVETIRRLSAANGSPPVYVYGVGRKLPLDYLSGGDLALEYVDPPVEVVLPKNTAGGVLAVIASDDSGVSADPGNYRATADDGPLVPGLLALGFVELPEQAVKAPDGYTYFRFFHLPAGIRPEGEFVAPPATLALANGLRLAGYRLEQPQAGVANLFLLWELPPDPETHDWQDFNLFVHLRTPRGETVHQQDWELHQYLGWRAGEYMLTRHAIDLPANWGPGLLSVNLGAYTRFGRVPVLWQDADARPAGPVASLGALAVRVEPPVLANAVDHRFGADLALQGYELEHGADGLTVRLLWQAARRMETNYTISVQVLDPQGVLIAQHDAEPVGGNYPTSAWQAQERVHDERLLALPASAQGSLVVVVYDSHSGLRLTVDGQADHLRLTSLAPAEERQ